MLLALGAASLVVLIACVNAANIMLMRAFRLYRTNWRSDHRSVRRGGRLRYPS